MTKLDDMLSKWPMPEPSQLEVDEAAERVASAIQGHAPSAFDESLLAAPLPKTAEEGQTSSPRTSRPGLAAPGIAVENKMSKDRTRDRTSFQELAKMATTPPPPSSTLPPSASTSGTTPASGVLRGEEATSSDSGIVDLKAIASADPSGSHRAQSTPLASSGLFEDESAPAKPALSASQAASVTQGATVAAASVPLASSSAASAVAQVAQPSSSSIAPKPAEKKGGGLVIAIGALVAAAAIAAGGFFFVKYQHAHGAVATTTVSSPDKPTETSTTKTQPTSATAAAASVVQNDPRALLEANDVTSDPQTGKPSMMKYRAKPGSAGGSTGTTTPEATATGAIDPKLVANLPTGNAGGGSGDLAEAMKTAAGGGTGLGAGGGGEQQKSAAGNVPPRPSQGQVAGAMGSVMPSAKACLGADEPMSRATVTFQSDGSVKSVSVSGFAAGKPQEACIKGALSKAKIDPFAEATYPVPVTIRSN